MGELKPYPDYKTSKLPWLGKIPKHWEEKRAKCYFREVDERSKTGNEELYNLAEDLEEKKDVAAQYPEKVEELRRALATAQAQGRTRP